MKKGNNLKFLVVILTFVLIISSMVLVIASANTEPASQPKIVSKNIAYEGDFALVLAIDASTVKGGSVSVKVWDDENPDLGTFSSNEAEVIEKLHPTNTYYVVRTPGVAAKDMAKEYKFQATDAEGNIGAVETYSVARYFYEMLFLDGKINAEADTEDYLRRDLYLYTLGYGARAQKLLASGTTLVTDYLFAKVPGHTFANGYNSTILDNNTTTVELQPYGGAVPEGKTFAGYTVTKYAKDTYTITTESASVGDIITLDAHTVVTPSFEFKFGQGYYFSDSNYTGDRFTYDTLTQNGNLKTDGTVDYTTKIGDTAEVIDGRLVYTRTQNDPDKGTYIRWNYTAMPTGTNSPKFIYETDFMFDGFMSKSISPQNMLFQANGINHQIVPGVESIADNEDTTVERNTLTIGKFTLTAGNWYNIRFELDYAAGTIEYFLNGVSLGTDALSAATTSNSRILWYYQNTQTAGQMSYDNTFIGWVDMNPPVEVEGGDFYNSENEGIRYNGDELLSELDVKPAEGTNASAVMEDGRLAFNQNGATGPSIKWEHGLTADGLTTPVFVYEADMSFDLEGSNSSAGYIKLYANGAYCYVEVQYWEDQVHFKGVGDSAIVLYNAKGKEYNVRFEIDYENLTLKCFVDGELKGTRYYSAFETNSSTHVTIEYRGTNITTGKITVDNLFIGMVEDGTVTE